MLVPLKWLGEFVDHGLSADELAAALTMGGLEVEGVIERHQGLDQVVVARVLKVEPHPNADRLSLVTVDAGDQPQTVVCGAPNARVDLVTALALPGAVLAGGLEVGQAKIRGVVSRGMLASPRELGVSDDHSGIAELPASLTPGTPIVEALGLETQVLEIGVTPNRGDALSLLGVARDVAALTGRPLTLPPDQPPETGEPIDTQAAVEIKAPEACGRYAARLVRSVTIGPSPLWMCDRLMACDLRPINNVVDITNYILMELGQPLHAFDFNRLAGGRIVVRHATPGEKFTTLDGTERQLSDQALLICDSQKPVALAGVMGGLNSEIADDTTEVLIESAFFDPLSIRRTSKRLGLSTESSYRFERTIDQDGCARAAHRAARLMAELAGGQVAPGVIDVHPRPFKPANITCSTRRISRYLGLELDRDQTMEPLVRLGLTVSPGQDDDSFTVRPPAFRPDLERPVDISEEVARIYGFDHIPVRSPVAELAAPPRAADQRLRGRVRDLMAAQGFDEAINYSFAHPADVDHLRLAPDDPLRRVVSLLNPLSVEQSVLRTSLLPGLLAAVRRNLGHRVPDVALFEVGRVFWSRPDEQLPREPMRMGAVTAGLAQPASWWAGEQPVSLAHARGAAEFLLEGLGLDSLQFAAPQDTPPYFQAGACLAVESSGRALGRLGEVHPRVRAAYDVDRPVFYLEMDLDAVGQLSGRPPVFKPLPRFPGITLDMAMAVDQAVPAGQVIAAAWDDAPDTLRDVSLFDVYQGKPLAKDQKSLGLRFTYRDDQRTLTEQEVLPDFEARVATLLKRFGGQRRA